MKKEELIKEVALKTCLSLKDAKSAVEATVQTIYEQLAMGEEVSLTGFGTFGSKELPVRTARNPRTGESVRVAAKRRLVFRPGKNLKEAVKLREERVEI